MANEKIDTAQNIIKPPVGDREREEDLLATLEAIPEENIMKMWAKMDEAERKEEEKKKWEIPQELKDFRELWKENIQNISDESKEKIIKAAEEILVQVHIEPDWNRIIEFNLWIKKYKILDINLDRYSDDEYKIEREYESVCTKKIQVRLWWMMWNNVNRRKNKKLAKYVKEQQKKWLNIPSKDLREDLLKELWQKANLTEESDQIAMLTYITGLYWRYRLRMKNWKSRFSLYSLASNRWFEYLNYNTADVCLMSCEYTK